MRGIWIALTNAALLAATPASAAQYAFSYGFNGTTIAFGTITTDDNVLIPGASNVIDVTGTRDGAAITGFQGFFDLDVEAPGDQQLYPARSSAYVDTSGLTFEVGDQSYNIASPSANSGGGPDGSYYELGFATADPGGPYTGRYVSFFTLSAVAAAPEPSAWAMMALGFGAIGVTARRRKTAQPVASAFSR